MDSQELRKLEENPSFTYSELSRLLSKYILAHKSALLDDRNSNVALCKDSPLAKLLGCTLFIDHNLLPF